MGMEARVADTVGLVSWKFIVLLYLLHMAGLLIYGVQP